jgi:hypothetical protein
VFTDTVTVAGLTVIQQAVGTSLSLPLLPNHLLKLVAGDSSKYPDTLQIDAFTPDGVAGLAFPQVALFGFNDLFSTLVSQDIVTEPRFGMKLAASGSELFLGGVNTDLFTGEIANTPVTQLVSIFHYERMGCSG